MKILLTGATGFVMRFVAAELLRRGNIIYCLVRGKKNKSPQERINEALSFVDISLPLHNCRVIEGDVTQPNLGISVKLENGFFDEVWHGAASISFKQEEGDLTRKINIGGTKNVLDFMRKNRIPTLRYFSTAYVCGRWGRTRFKENDLDGRQKFHNIYETSKFEVEKLLSRQRGLNITIFRPSIIVGDSQDGKIVHPSGYYSMARMFLTTKEIVKREMRQNEKQCFDEGFYIREDGLLNFPVKIPCDPESTVNIVHVDYLANAVCDIAENVKGGVFHIVNNSRDLPTVRWLFDTSLNFLGLGGFHLVDLDCAKAIRKSIIDVATKDLLHKLELAIFENGGVYLPYMTNEPVFDDSNTRHITGMIHPDITEETIKMLLSFALATDFGKNGNGKKPVHPKEAILVAS